MIRRLSLGLFLCATVSACGGGGGGGSTLPRAVATAAPKASPAAAAQSIRVAITIPAPPKAGSAIVRRPRYVSVNTQSAAISVNGGSAAVADLASGSPNCTALAGGGRTCTITISAPVGNDTFGETMYASTDGTGAPLSTASTAATIVAGKANVVNLTLEGIVASIALTLSNPTPPLGTPAQIPLTINFNDASGAAIIGSDPFVNPITLSDSDSSGATTLSLATLSSPADATNVTVAYTGAKLAQATFSASASGVASGSITPAVLTPVAGSPDFVDWPTYAYDSQRSGFNPASTAITPASIGQLHLAWQRTTTGDSQTQPIVATNIAGHQAIVIIGNFNGVKAFDALTGQTVWETDFGTQNLQGCGTAPVAGTAFYDRALGAVFVAGGNGSNPNHVIVYRLDVGTGELQAQVDVTPSLLTGEAVFGHTAVTYANGLVYVGTGSNCEGTLPPGLPSWRGRVVAVDPGSMQIVNTFFTTYGQGNNFGGGGVWSWGGVSADPSGNIYAATGNAETTNAVKQTVPPPFVLTDDEQAGYAEHLVKLAPDLSSVQDSNYPGFNFSIGGADLDYAGTPVVYQPPLGSGCGLLTATMGKGGTLVLNDTRSLTPALNSFNINVPSGKADGIGNPAYSPNTGLLYAAIATSGNGSLLLPPGMVAISGCGSSAKIAWSAQFGPDSAGFARPSPRSAPTVTAGGVAFMGVPGTGSGAVWAVDATTGAVLGGGQPVLTTGDVVLLAPSTSGDWIFVLDNSGNLYGLTIDSSVNAVAAVRGRRVAPKFTIGAP